MYQPAIDSLFNGFRSGRRFYSISNVLCESENMEIPEELTDQQLISVGIENVLTKFQTILPESLQNKVDELLNGNEKIIISLAWWLISRYFSKRRKIDFNDIHSDTLFWCQQIAKGYRGVNVTNFTNSWRDGCALLAILHYYKSSLYDFESRLSKNSGQNLTLGLHLANQEFGCMRLLEVDNFTSSLILDWKSICLFIMELRECLSAYSPIDSKTTLNDQNNQIFNPSFDSMIENFHSEFSTILQMLETVIQQLDVAETRVKVYENIKDAKQVLETFTNEDDLFIQLKLIKESVVEHESLMEKLTKHQDSIQTILMKGNAILEIPFLENTNQMKATINEKLEFITNKWNDLYKHSTEFQRKLHKSLYNMQMSFLIKIEDSIEQLEEIRKNQTNFGNSIDQLKDQLKVNRTMEMKIESTEKFISALKTFLIYSEDSDHSDSEEEAENRNNEQIKRISRSISDSSFEQHLQLIGSQWNDLVNWVNCRYNSLQKILLSWRHFEEEIQGISDWLEERICTADQLLRKSSKNQFNDFLNYTESKWGRMITNLDKCGQKIKDSCENENLVVTTVDAKIEEIIQYWNDVSEKWRDSIDNWTGIDSKRKSNRAASFSDMSSENYFNRRKIENDTRNTPSSQSDMNINAYPVQAGYKTKFENDAEQMMSWLENSAEKLELITLESIRPEERPSIIEQRKTIDTVTNEINIAKSKKQMETIKRMGQVYQDDLNKHGENTDEIEQLFEELDERWSYLENQLLKSRHKVLTLELSAQLENESQEIDACVQNADKFLHNIQYNTDLSGIDKLIKYATELREKLIEKKNFLKQFTDKYQVVKSDLSRLNEEIFTKQISDLNQKVINQLQIIENEQIKMRNTKTIMEMDLVKTENFLNELSNIMNEKLCINSFDNLEREQIKYQSLRNKLENHSQILSKIPIPDSSSRRYKILMDLQKHSHNINTRLDKRVHFLDDLSNKSLQWKNQTVAFNQWLDEVSSYLDECEQQTYDDTNVINEALKETEAGIQDMQNLIPTLENIEKSTFNLEAYFENDLRNEIHTKRKDLQNKWENLHKRYITFRDYLQKPKNKTDNSTDSKFKTAPQKVAIIVESESRTEDSLIDIDMEHSNFSTESLDNSLEKINEIGNAGSSENIDQKLLSEIESWIKTSTEKLGEYSNIHSADELNTFGQLVAEMQNHKLIYSDKLKEIRAINICNEINDKFENFCNFLESEYQRFKDSNFHLKDVKNILSGEDKWMGKVDRVMQQSFSCDHLDVEKLSENIDEIEKAVCDHSEEDFNRLEDLKYSLMNARVLERSVSMEIEQIKEKSLVIKNKATMRLGSLQQLLEHVQSVERRVSQMTTWIYDTTNLIKARIVADLLGSDLPEEFEILKQNFQDWEKFLLELEDLENGKRYQGRKETSERLRLQRLKLQKSFRPLKELFSRYSRPADFEPRLDNLKREVNRVAEHIYLLDIISISPEDLENCEAHAKQFKESLVSSENDLKYVFDLGKELAERKEIEFPERFSLQLDSLKKRYYNLLDQITEAEEKLVLARPLVKEIYEKQILIDEALENSEQDQTILINFDQNLVSDLLESSEKLKAYTDYDNSELVREMFEEIKEKYVSLLNKKDEAINKQNFVTKFDQLHDEADKLLMEIDQTDFSDENKLEGKLDSLYSKTNQIKQVASQIVNAEETQKIQEEINKYPILEEKLDKIFTAISEHQIPNGHIENANKSDSDRKIIEETILSNSASSLQNEMESSFLKSRENSFGDSLSSPYSVEDVSSNENVVSDLAYSVQAAKIEKNILQQVSMEIKDHIHSFILFCQNNLGSGMALSGSAAKSITTLNDLKFKINCIKETITEIFREQRFYIDHRLRELSAYADTPDQLEELDKIQRYWLESIGKLNKRIGRLAEINKRIEDVEITLKEYEIQPSEKLRTKALRFVSQIEEELNVNLQKDRLKLTSCGRLGSQDINISKSNSSNSVSQLMNQDMANIQDNYRENLKTVREQLKEIGRRLNTVRIYIDDSRRGCLSKLSERIQEIDDKLADCSHMLAEVQYTMASGIEHQNTDSINLNFLIEAQKKRLGKYHNEFQSHLNKWMENASRWQEFVEKLEKLQNDLQTIEQDLISIENGLNYSEQEMTDNKKSLSFFEKKLVLLEQDGDNLSISCNDVDADFLRNRLSDLRSRYTICLQSNRSPHMKKSDDKETVKITSSNELYNGNNSDYTSNEKLSNNYDELKQSRSSELDLNGNSIHSSQDSLPNDDYETSSGESSGELSTMIDGAATVLTGNLNNWAKLTSNMILEISVNKFSSIEELEDKITEITKVKKESLERIAQISMGLDKQSNSENNSINAELSSQLTDESNSQLHMAYQDLNNLLYMKTNELTEIKVQYYHIKDHLTTLENLSEEIDVLSNYPISEQLLDNIKIHYADSDIRLLEKLINKMPDGLRQNLEIYFKNLQPTIKFVQAKFFDSSKEKITIGDEYPIDSQLTQENINQIAVLLKSINTFMVNSKVNLGQIDDIEDCLDNIRIFQNRLEEHSNILQSILEKKSIYSNQIPDSNFSETVEKVDRLWNNTKEKLKDREDELMNIHQLRIKLDDRELLLKQWMEDSEDKLNRLLSEGFNSRNQKILDDVKIGIPNWQQAMNDYQSMSYELKNSHSAENCKDLEYNLEQMNKQWSAIMSKLTQCTRELNSTRTPQEQNIHHFELTEEQTLSTSNEVHSGISIEKLSGWLSSLEGQLETIEMGIVRWRSGSGLLSTGNADKLKLKLSSQLNDLLNEIGLYKTQFQLCSESEKNDSEYQISKRWKIFNEKINETKQCLEGSMETGQNLLTKLRLLNDWLAHKEADLLEQKGNLCNVYSSAQNQLSKFETFLADIESHRTQIEDAIEQTQNQIGETIDSNKFLEQSHTINLESEGESDNSDTGSNGNVPDDKSKRLHRRLRRHSHYMKRKWIELNLKMRDFYEYLKKKSQLLKSIDIQTKECNQLLSELEFHIDNWANVANIKLSIIPQEISQTKSLIQSTQPLTEKLATMEAQKIQLQNLKVSINEEILKEFEKITSRISYIKSLCEMRLKQLHQQELTSIKQTPSNDEPQIPMFHDSVNSISRKIDLPLGLSENRKFIELENESVSYPWERCLHPSGSEVPYYKNHSTQDTQWDHPIMADLIKSFDELNTIRFSAYRTAMKLRALQKVLCLDFIDMNLVSDTFRLCGVQTTSVNDRLLDVGQIIVFLASLYRAANQKMSKRKESPNTIANDEPDKLSHSILGCARGSSIRHSRSKDKSHHTRSNSFGGFRNENEKDDTSSKPSCIKSPSKTISSQAAIMKCSGMANIPSTRTLLSTGEYEINVPVCVDLALNWLLNVYDSARNGKIRVLSLKTAIVILTNASLDEKYKYLFSLVCNNQGQMDSSRLTMILTDCVLIPKHLNESSSFGAENVKPSVISCFKNSAESGNHRFIRLNHFLSWLRLEPQSLVWLPVLNRIISAESAVHQAKCGVCKIQPIVGLRYRCLRCLNFDLCQACFFYSKTSKNHKVSHPMQEYCNVTSSRENFRDYSRIFRNRFRSKSHIRRQTKLSYLPVQNGSNPDNIETKIPSTSEGNPELMSTNHQIHSRVEQYANRLAEVEHINKSNIIVKSGNIESKYEPLMLTQDFNGDYKDRNRDDEEHKIIFQHTETLRKHQRNKSLTMNNQPTILQTQKSLDTSLTNMQNLPQMKPITNSQYSVPQSQNLPGFKRYPFEQDPINPNNFSNSAVSSSDDLRVRNSNSSLNHVIHGLENQKRQLMAEYERLQLQTPTNNLNPVMSPILSTDTSSRYAPVEFGFAQANRTMPYNQSIPPITSRKSNRGLVPLSPNPTSLDRTGTYLPPSEDLVTEARMLRQHKGRLEARMGLLEQHNRQLEAQLSRLRQLIDESPNNPNNFMPTSNIINAFGQNSINVDQDPEMLTAAQYAASKRINEISSISPIYNNSLRFQGVSGNDPIIRNYQNSSSIYSGTRSTPVQNFYGSLERGSAYRGAYDSTPVGFNYRNPNDRQVQPTISPANYTPNPQLKASSETGGSLSESEFQFMCRSLADSCPAVTLAPAHGQSSNSIGSLFHMAGQVGKAVGQLVNVMTDDFNNNQDRDSPGSKTPTLNPNKPTPFSTKPIFNEDLVLPTSNSIMNHPSKSNSNFN